MSLLRLAGCLTLLSQLSFGCKERGEHVLRDTEGRTFSATCESSGACVLSQRDGPRADLGGSPRLSAKGRIFGVCAAAPADHAGHCRALVCSRDEECPRAEGTQSGTCVGSFCVDPSHELGTTDAIMLCLAGTGLGYDTPHQVARYALGLNCGSPCKVPAPCRQP